MSDPRGHLSAWQRWLNAPLLAAVYVYRVTLSPFVGGRCRFHPTCSVYAQEALRMHGPIRGGWLAARRVLRCHPFGGHGFDPVPPRSQSPAGTGSGNE